MAYKRFGMSDLPPCFTRNPHLKLTAHQVNGIIVKAYDETVLVKKVECTEKSQNSLKIYLDSAVISKIHKVTLVNPIGDDITYVAEFTTGSYSNYITINRPLEVGESLEIEYSIKPTTSEMLTNYMDVVYLRDEIYTTLINILYQLAMIEAETINKNKKGVKQDGKH